MYSCCQMMIRWYYSTSEIQKAQGRPYILQNQNTPHTDGWNAGAGQVFKSFRQYPAYNLSRSIPQAAWATSQWRNDSHKIISRELWE